MDVSQHPLGDAALRAHLDTLAARDPAVAGALRDLGYPPPRLRPPGFATLIQIMVAQQLSTRAAAAIWARLENRLNGRITPERLLALDAAAFRAIGFSERKVAHARGAAEAIAAGTLDLAALADVHEDEAIAAISQLKGFGRWSAEIYLLFALGRTDAFPAADLGIQLGMQRLRGLPGRPDERQTRDLALPWQPLRGCAAILLWHVYGRTTLAMRGAGDEYPA
jgi:DNA-3-methyladenine glycosylase II